jgi:hypothetical protein
MRNVSLCKQALKQLTARHKEADKKSQAAFKLMFSADKAKS